MFVFEPKKGDKILTRLKSMKPTVEEFYFSLINNYDSTWNINLKMNVKILLTKIRTRETEVERNTHENSRKSESHWN